MSEKKKNDFFGSMPEVKLNELRQRILGLDTEDLKRLAVLVNDPDKFSEEISQLLPNSIKILIRDGKVNYSDLVPLIESALKDSIERNPQALSNILFPVMLPAIRKAVADDIRNLIESLNTTLEHSFSPQRIGWRFKAMFSGMSYAEIVISNAYIYRVRQVFLIHKESGLLLNSATEGDEKVAADDDMVSSMLSAIKDFVQDSFSVGDDNELNTIKVGKFNIWIEQGPDAILAVVIDGDAPSGLRSILKDSIEKIHLKFAYYLARFKGDVSDFKKTDSILANCLVSEQKKKKKKKPIVLIILFVLLFIALGYWVYITIDKNIRINKLENALNSEPGIVITDYERSDGKVVFTGLKDPNSKSPYEVSQTFHLDTNDVDFDLKPFLSLDPKLILVRAYSYLNPDVNTVLTFENNTLFVRGKPSNNWLDFAKTNYRNILGVSYLNTDGIDETDEVETPINNDEEIKYAMSAIEKYIFIFKYTEVKLNEEQLAKFNNLIIDINTLYNFDFEQDSVPVIMVIGHTSYIGNAEANERVAYDRAEQFINLMINAEIPMEVLVPKTSFVEDETEKFPVRSVSFKVTYSKP